MSLLHYICKTCHLRYSEAWNDPAPNPYRGACPRCGASNAKVAAERGEPAPLRAAE